jgi:hypothetical protein
MSEEQKKERKEEMEKAKAIVKPFHDLVKEQLEKEYSSKKMEEWKKDKEWFDKQAERTANALRQLKLAEEESESSEEVEQLNEEEDE